MIKENVRDLDFENDPHLFTVYFQEILGITNDIGFSAQNLNGSMKEPELFFYFLRNLFFSIGRLTQFLWPTQNRGRGRFRASKLRERLGIEGEWYLKDLKFRNDLAHFDERIDDWNQTSPRRNMARKCIGPRGMFGGDGLDQKSDFLEVFFTDDSVAVFASNEYKIQEAMDEVAALQEKVAAALKNAREQC